MSRLLLKAKPYAVGTKRQRKAGLFIKQSPGHWTRAEDDSSLAERFALAGKPASKLIWVSRQLVGGASEKLAAQSGAPGAARAFLEQAFRHGPARLRKETLDRFLGAFSQMLQQDGKAQLCPLPKALSHIRRESSEPGWDLYAARRMAAFNDGLVDLDLVWSFAARAKAMHGGRLPRMAGKHALVKSYTGPRTAADVTVASWDAYFREGGTLNQPAWLETGRLKELRRQFETFANLHRAKA